MTSDMLLYWIVDSGSVFPSALRLRFKMNREISVACKLLNCQLTVLVRTDSTYRPVNLPEG